jgi:hypothetical protein
MRYKKGERVEFKEKEGYGVIVDVIVKKSATEDAKPRCEILYLVKPDGAEDFDQYLVCSRKDLRHEQIENVNDLREHFQSNIDIGDGFKLLMYGYVFDGPLCVGHNDIAHGFSSYTMVDEIKKQLYITYAICSKDDEYDIWEGLKLCRHRLKEQPYIKMYAEREGEFDSETVKAILLAKANYIKQHRDRFINKRGVHFEFKKNAAGHFIGVEDVKQNDQYIG